MARAQEMAPFAIPQIITGQDDADLAVDFDDSFNAIENPYFSDMLKLNYQISLLDKLVSRQGELNKISEIYASLGLPFTPPPPPKGICQQVPANYSCLTAYSDLYPDVVAQRKAHYQKQIIAAKNAEPDRKPNESDEAMIARQKKEAEEKAIRDEAEARKTRYQWAELTCLSGQCRGVLVNSKDDTVRYTVHQGTRLPDGTMVESVKPGDVRVSIDGDMIKLRPAPGQETNTGASNPIGNALSATLGVGGGGAPTTSGSSAAAANVIANANGGSAAAALPGQSSMPAPPVPTSASNGPAAGAAAPPAEQNAAPLGPSGLF